MALTRANVESILVQRAGPLMTKAGLATTVAGSNASLNDPIGWGIRQAGGSVTTYTLVADADVATVAAADTDLMLDLAELRLLKNILTNLTLVDTTVGPRREALDQLAKRVEKRIDSLEDEIEENYGWGASTLESGFIGVEFAEHTEVSEDEIL